MWTSQISGGTLSGVEPKPRASKSIALIIKSSICPSTDVVAMVTGQEVFVGFVPKFGVLLSVLLLITIELLFGVVLLESLTLSLGFISGPSKAVGFAIVGLLLLESCVAVGVLSLVVVLVSPSASVVLLVLMEITGSGPGFFLGSFLGTEVLVSSASVVVETLVVVAILGFVVVKLLLALDVLIGNYLVALLVDAVQLGLIQVPVGGVQVGGRCLV